MIYNVRVHHREFFYACDWILKIIYNLILYAFA